MSTPRVVSTPIPEGYKKISFPLTLLRAQLPSISSTSTATYTSKSISTYNNSSYISQGIDQNSNSLILTTINNLISTATMYGSYGSYSSSSSSNSSFSSYSSYSSMSAPMDITPSPLSSRGPDASCAFPSWPRRTSLSESDAYEERATSFLSDEDLLGPQDVFEDDSRSVSSNGSNSPYHHAQSPQITEAEILERQREQAAYQREVMRFLMSEKERRREQAKRKSKSGSRSSSKKSSPKNKLGAMTPIAEAE